MTTTKNQEVRVMPDRSAENLRRLRAWDAEWDESKHNREDNGRFGIPRMRGGDPDLALLKDDGA